MWLCVSGETQKQALYEEGDNHLSHIHQHNTQGFIVNAQT